MKHYLQFDPSDGYPVAWNIFYECLKCGNVVASRPIDSLSCTCRNINVNIKTGQILIKDEASLRVFKES